jgi:hypothetical protein
MANLGLGTAAATLWLQRTAEPVASGVVYVPAVDPAASPFPRSPDAGPKPDRLSNRWEPFAWRQIESEDYRQYMANLRGLGCPERLIRDLIVAELDDWYQTRRNRLRVDLHQHLPAWAGADRREAVRREEAQKSYELDQEQWMVTTELLGFPWSRHAKDLCLQPSSILTGHVTTDQAIQTVNLFEIYRQRLAWVHDRTRGVLLSEDRAELAALSGELQAQLETILGPDQWEELLLRGLWTDHTAEARFELADLTGAELRQVVQIYSQLVGGIGEVLGSIDVSDAELTRRAIEFDRSTLELLGPEKAGQLTRARDDRFHTVLDFAQEHQLPRNTAITAYEIQVAAEEEAQRLRATAETETAAIEARLETIQMDTLAALTRVLGKAHLHDYLADAGRWLTSLDANSVGKAELLP